MKTRYDYIIAGGGCAGRSLAYYLTQSSLRGCSVLLVEKTAKTQNDRTWCFWSNEPTAFDAIVFHRWNRLAFADRRGAVRQQLGPVDYQMIRGIDFYRHVDQQLARFPNIERLQGVITNLSEDADGPYALVDGQRYYGKYVFNTCLHRPAAPSPDFHHLLQHFSGRVIRADKDVFDPEEAMLMDFRTPQHGAARFFYVLPFSRREALIEYTLFSKSLLQKEAYEQALDHYIQEKLNLTHYEVLEREYGVIPMTDAPFPTRRTERILNLGTVGGAVKPTTGYAFLNIQRQAQTVVAQLAKGERPDATRPYPARFRFYDTLLLHILEREGHLAASIFSALFRNNPMRRILTFLDERSHLLQEAAIFSRLPVKPFLWAVFNTKIFPKLTPRQQPVLPYTEEGER